MRTPSDDTPLSDEEIAEMMNKFMDAEIVNPADTIDPDARERVNRAALNFLEKDRVSAPSERETADTADTRRQSTGNYARENSNFQDDKKENKKTVVTPQVSACVGSVGTSEPDEAAGVDI